jgi:tRNA (guanine37-N1)-methyltransferase
VLTGGELPAMIVTDAVARLIPGVLGGAASAHDESFSDPGLLEYPHYTRPIEFRGQAVPEVLQNGHHAEIAKWRAEQAQLKTRRNRPDLLS